MKPRKIINQRERNTIIAKFADTRVSPDEVIDFINGHYAARILGRIEINLLEKALTEFNKSPVRFVAFVRTYIQQDIALAEKERQELD